MASQRVRIDAHIEDYLRSQSERVLGKVPDQLSPSDLTTLTNTLLYEHKLAQSISRQLPLNRLVSWLTNLIPMGGKVIPMPQLPLTEAAAPKPQPDNFDFDADLGDLYEQDAA